MLRSSQRLIDSRIFTDSVEVTFAPDPKNGLTQVGFLQLYGTNPPHQGGPAPRPADATKDVNVIYPSAQAKAGKQCLSLVYDVVC